MWMGGSGREEVGRRPGGGREEVGRREGAGRREPGKPRFSPWPHPPPLFYAELAAASSAEMRGRAVAAPKLLALAGVGSVGLRVCQSVTA